MTARGRLSFVADVHVPHAIVHAMSGSRFEVTTVPDAVDDYTVPTRAAADSSVLLTNDRDFTNLHESVDHAGIIIYSTAPRTAAEFLRGLRRIDRQFTVESIENTILWLDEWI